jgi:stage V sporulation protein SpoVS
MSLETKTLICSSTTNPRKLACAIRKELAKNKSVNVDAIGAKALNQAIKACCYINNRSSLSGNLPVYCYPKFAYREMNDNKLGILVRLEVK